MKILHLNRERAEAYRGTEPYLMISLTDPGSPMFQGWKFDDPQCVGVYYRQVWDADRPIPEIGITPDKLFTERDAEELVNFVNANLSRINQIVVHCEAGISRSAGCAAALAMWLNGDDSPWWYPEMYGIHSIPNRLIYGKVLGAARRVAQPARAAGSDPAG